MDDRRRDGGTNSTLRTKEQGTHLTLNEHDDDDDDIYEYVMRLNLRMYQSLHLNRFQNEVFRVHKTNFFKSEISSSALKQPLGSLCGVTIRKRRNINFFRNVNLKCYIILKWLLHIQGGARNVIPLIVHITHFYYYKSI